MARRRRKKLPQDPVTTTVEALSHDGRGIAHVEGKTVFLDAALPGETVSFRYTDKRRKFDEGRTEEVVSNPAPDRQPEPCQFALACGGCSLQHLTPDAQIAHKQATLLEQFEHFGSSKPERILPALLGPTEGYRRKARLAVRYVPKKGGALVGFREKRNSFVTSIDRCLVMDPRVGQRIEALKELISTLECRDQLPQIEVAMGDPHFDKGDPHIETGDAQVALVFRHLQPLSEPDQAALYEFCKAHEVHCYLQPGGPQTVHKIWPHEGEDRLFYRMEAFDLIMGFHPMDFTQVNADINRDMVAKAIELLDLNEQDEVLDLFCGLGNFTLPIARRAHKVIGVEGGEAMVERGRENAERNGLNNVEFFAADLTQPIAEQPWAQDVNKMLIDPPRSGALELIQQLSRFKQLERIVYVSCNPATLARDAGELVQQGFTLKQAGVMDMFPHTAHVESIAWFERAL